MSDTFSFTLKSPLTEEQINLITDAEFEHTDRIWFDTPKGKHVEFVKASQWIPCSERLPSEEERKEWIDKNLGGIGYLYPCLVTRYSSINPDRTKKQSVCGKTLL